MALCLPGPVRRGTEEGLRELGLLVEGAGPAGKGLVPLPESSGVDFGSQTPVRAYERVPRGGNLNSFWGALFVGMVKRGPRAPAQEIQEEGC